MFRIGCVQSNPIFGDVESNLKTFEQVISQADADLLVFPELALTGYFFISPEEAKKYAEPIDGAIVRRIKALAKEKNIAIVTGFLESGNGALYNSAIAIDCHGKFAGHYRKM